LKRLSGMSDAGELDAVALVPEVEGSAVAEVGSVVSELGSAVAELGSVVAEVGSVVAELGSVVAELGSAASELGSIVVLAVALWSVGAPISKW
jgi:phage-related minor tail protein